MMSCESVYSRFIEFSERAAGIYLRIASLFCEHKQLSQFWNEMAVREKQHARLLRFCVFEELFAMELPDSEQIRHVARVLARLERDIRAPVFSLEEAFDIAVRVETSGLNDIYDYLTSPVHRSFYLFRRKTQISLPGSIQTLAKAGRECGFHKSVRKLDHHFRSGDSKKTTPPVHRKVS